MQLLSLYNVTMTMTQVIATENSVPPHTDRRRYTDTTSTAECQISVPAHHKMKTNNFQNYSIQFFFLTNYIIDHSHSRENQVKILGEKKQLS